MGALVQQHAAAFAFPGGAPVAGIVVNLRAVPVGDDPVDPLQLTQLAAVDHLVHLAVDAVGALVEHHGKDLAALFGGLVHLPHGLGVDARGLLAHDVQTGRESLHGQRGMLVVGSADVHGVAQAGLDKVAALLENGGAFGQGVLGPLAAGLPAVGHGSEFNLGALARQDIGSVAGTHIAHADDAKTYFCHK